MRGVKSTRDHPAAEVSKFNQLLWETVGSQYKKQAPDKVRNSTERYWPSLTYCTKSILTNGGGGEMLLSSTAATAYTDFVNNLICEAVVIALLPYPIYKGGTV